MPSQGLQELDNIRALAPMPCTSNSLDFAVSEGLGLHFQIDLCIDMGRVQRHVSQPAPDSVDVDTCPQQVTGSRMSDGVRTNVFVFERRQRRARLSYRSPDQGVDAKPSQRLSETVQEHPLLRTTAAYQSFEQAGSIWPQRTAPDLVAFPDQSNGIGASHVTSPTVTWAASSTRAPVL